MLARTLVAHRPLHIGKRTLAEHRLKDGDEFRVGSTTVLFEEPAENALHLLDDDEDEPLRQRSVSATIPVPAEQDVEPLSSVTSVSSANVVAVETPAVRKPGTREGLATDLLIYGLACVILALSIAGLLLLLQAE